MKYLLRFHWIWIIIWFGGWGVFFFVFHQNTWLNWSGDGSRWLVSSHVLSPPHHQATSFTFTKEVKEGEVEEEGEEETFDEGVRIQPLKFGHVAFTFNFTFTRPHPPYFPASTTHPKREHYTLFPRSLGQVLDEFKIHTLDVTLTQGRWLRHVWGSTPWSRWQDEAPPGMDLRAWFLPFNNHLTTSSRRDLETQWIHFTHAFSGLVCSSLPSAIRESRSMTYPRWTFSDRFHGVHFNTSRRSVQHVHMALARESVCTENLTPWMKWIPGHAQHGVSSTLDAYKVLDSNYHSIQLHVDLKCSSPLKCKQILTLNLVVVFSVPRVLNLPQFEGPGYAPWSYVHLFGSLIPGKCPLARSSQIQLVIPPLTHSVSPTPSSLFKQNEWTLATYTLKEKTPLDLMIDYPSQNTSVLSASPQPLFSFQSHRFITGPTLEAEAMHVSLKNLSPRPQTVLYYDVFPWFFPRFLHTLTCTCHPTHVTLSPAFLSFQHAVDRIQPSVLEIVYTIPGHTECLMSMQFERSMLHFSEYRPDSSRGYDISAGIITFLKNESDVSATQTLFPMDLTERPRMYVNPLQAHLPAPDFSMPYNVITFTSTAIALFFASIFGLTTRRFYTFSINDQGAPVIETDGSESKKIT